MRPRPSTRTPTTSCSRGSLAALALTLLAAGCPSERNWSTNPTDPRYDHDGDGYCPATTSCEDGSAPGDCNDQDPGIHPGAWETCGDDVDFDCSGEPNDGIIDVDMDGDIAWYCDGGEDCDDNDPLFNASDGDNDGVTSCDGDCDDDEPLVHPDMDEICNDGMDNECDDDVGDCRLAGTIDMDTVGASFVGQAGDNLGWASAAISAGDLDGDGHADVMLGSVWSDTAGEDAGMVYVHLGPILGSEGLLMPEAAAATITGEAAGDQAARGLASLGDVNGDGYDDIVVGAKANDEAAEDAGAVYLVLGPVEEDISLAQADGKYLGVGAGDNAGLFLSSAGHTDGDAITDLLVGAWLADTTAENAGEAYLVTNPSAEVASLADATAILTGEVANDRAGNNVASGDIDGDGDDDLLIAAYLESTEAQYAGAVYMVSSPITGTHSLADATAKLLGEAEGDKAGYGLGSGGDVNGDGIDDILVGAHFEDEGGDGAGAVYVVYGPIEGLMSLSDADAKLVGEGASDYAGGARLTDLDGDGFDDVLVSAPGTSGIVEHARQGYVVYGPVSGTIPLAEADVHFVSQDLEGRCCGVYPGGDINGDGLDDLLISDNESPLNGDGAGAVHVVLGSGW